MNTCDVIKYVTLVTSELSLSSCVVAQTRETPSLSFLASSEIIMVSNLESLLSYTRPTKDGVGTRFVINPSIIPGISLKEAAKRLIPGPSQGLMTNRVSPKRLALYKLFVKLDSVHFQSVIHSGVITV